jgi:lipid-binding SYLF domain-containing protein
MQEGEGWAKADIPPVDGIVTEDKKKKIKLVRKIPPKVIAEAKGLAIFTSMRSGIAPLGGAGGAGLVTAKLPDGSECWTKSGSGTRSIGLSRSRHSVTRVTLTCVPD